MKDSPNSQHSPHRPVRFGLVGCGRVAHTHVEAIQALGGQGELAAVCDTDPEALHTFTASTGAAGYTDLAEMAARPDLDVISVCTPSGVHARHAITAAEAGKHVLVEKPLDVTLEAVDRMMEACEENGVQLLPILQNRFNPTVQLVKEALDAGRFGRLLAVNSTVIWHRDQAYYDSADWRGTRAMDGGAFLNQGIHFVDMMRYLGGEVTEVVSMLGAQARNMECEDTGSALLKFENGALGNIFVTMAGLTDLEGSVTLIGETGYVKIGGTAMNRMEDWQFDSPLPEQDGRVRDSELSVQSVYGCGHQYAYLHTCRHIKGASLYPILPGDAAASLKVLMQMYDRPGNGGRPHDL